MDQLDFNLNNRSLWRWLLNLWTLTTIIAVGVDFFLKNQYTDATNLICTIYIALLGIYTADKEIERWTAKKRFISKHWGELYVVAWTFLIIGCFLLEVTNTHKIKTNSALAATYISTISIFAVSSKSKEIYKQKTKK